MSNLRLKSLKITLKKVYFAMTLRYGDIEFYRPLTPYWYSRMVLYDGRIKTQRFWIKYITGYGCFNPNLVSFKNYDYQIVTLGYPKKQEIQRVRVYNHLNIRIDYGQEKWGAVNGVKYFVITHGEVL